MNYKTLGVILQDIFKMPVTLEQSSEIGTIIKSFDIEPKYIYVETPSHTGEIYTSRAYDFNAETEIKKYLKAAFFDILIENSLDIGKKALIEKYLEKQNELPF